MAAYGSGSEASDEDDDDIADITPVSIQPPTQTEPSTTAVTDTYELASQKLQNFIDAGDYRIVSDDSSDEESDDDDLAIGQVVLSGGSDDDSDVEIVSKSRAFVKARGELGIDDLPPIEDLKITVPEEECVRMGKIFSVVEQLGKYCILIFYCKYVNKVH